MNDQTAIYVLIVIGISLVAAVGSLYTGDKKQMIDCAPDDILVRAGTGGQILMINKKVGDAVKEGDVVAVIETASERETSCIADEGGIVKSVIYQADDICNADDAIIVITKDPYYNPYFY